MVKKLLVMCFLISFCYPVFAEEGTVYTNDDLGKYKKQTPQKADKSEVPLLIEKALSITNDVTLPGETKCEKLSGIGRQLSFVNTDNETIATKIKRINALIEKFCEGIKPKNVRTPNGEKEIHVGMTTDEARQVVGNPSSISKSGGSYGTREEWVYSRSYYIGSGVWGDESYLYLYFEEGKLTSWQER